MKTRVLVVEDDAHILLGLEEVLRGEGFEVTTCTRGDEAIEYVERVQPELVILDVMLPGQSGFEVCKELRARKDPTLVLMLTAKGQEIDKVVGLELGADDYVTKPFGVRELVARVRALLRRTGRDGARSDGPVQFTIGEATINPKTFELHRGRHSETLTARELRVLQFFHTHLGEVLSRDRLLNEIWGYHYYGTTRTLDQVIVQLRRKLGPAGRCLQTVHGVGYKLVA